MNANNIDRLIEHLKTQTICGFNMADFVAPLCWNGVDHSGHDCNTVACLAGHIVLLEANVTDDPLSWVESLPLRPDFLSQGQNFLGLTYDQAYDLFHGRGLRLKTNIDLPQVTLEQAIKVLEHLKETGEVEWSILQTSTD